MQYPIHLDQPVEGHPADNGVGEELDDREEGEDDPVHQPLGVVRLRACLEGLDGPAKQNNILIARNKAPVKLVGDIMQYSAGRPIICKVLKTRIWVVPPVCLGSR